ncbi:UNVERIFIED_CONTAM: Polypeptide N-acetylgalactosaminyltransferase 16 [Gekko kuhli]
MRRIRANAIAILTVAWILGTFYYLWQDNKPHSAASSRSPSSGGGRNGQRSTGKLELHKDERTIPLIGEMLVGVRVHLVRREIGSG